jgi:hypothetical protein
MATNPLVRRLEELGPEEWHGYPPADLATIEKVERRFNVVLPEDYRALLLFSSGGSLYRHKTKLELDPAEDLIYRNEDEDLVENLKGMLIIGGDAGDCIFYYDPTGRLGHGSWALYEVEMGVLTPELALPRSKYIAPDLRGLVEAILRNESLYNRPYLIEPEPED